jgi:hypothetical protein
LTVALVAQNLPAGYFAINSGVKNTSEPLSIQMAPDYPLSQKTDLRRVCRLPNPTGCIAGDASFRFERSECCRDGCGFYSRCGGDRRDGTGFRRRQSIKNSHDSVGIASFETGIDCFVRN